MVDGKQFAVISAGGGKSGRPAGGSVVAAFDVEELFAVLARLVNSAG
jgi:hypothetical protein